MKKTALMLAALALMLAACGQADSDSAEVASLDDTTLFSDEGTAATNDVDTETAMLAMAECMREEGVDVADPEVDEDGNIQPPRPVDADGVDREALRSAREACSEYLEGIEFGFQTVDQTELQDTLLAYAACMRQNGYDMPDPDAAAIDGGPGPGGGPFGDIDRTDPDFATAQEACQEVLGDFGARGIGGGPGGGRA